MAVEILINGFFANDTNLHSYQTDPSYFFYPKVGRTVPPTTSFTIWVDNTTDQSITITPISNIVNNGSTPDLMLIDPYVVAPNSTDMRFFPYDDFPINYLSLMAQFSAVPTTGSVIAYLILNGSDPVVEVITPTPSPTPTKPLSGFYKVIMTETGLPTGSVWSVNINGVTKQTNTNQIIFYETNGQYSYQIYGTNYYVNQNQFYTYAPSPASGTITVNNSDVNINITFTGTQTPVQDIYSGQAEITDILNSLSSTGSFSINNGDVYSSQMESVGYYNFSVNTSDIYSGQAEIPDILNSLNSNGSFSVNGGDVYSSQAEITDILNNLNLTGSFSVNSGDVYSSQSDSFTYTNS